MKYINYSVVKLAEMYSDQKMSLSDISKKTGISISTIRSRIKDLGILRTQKEAISYAIHKWVANSSIKGRKMSDKAKENQRAAALKRWDGNAKGISIKPKGYCEYTIGTNKGKLVHVVIMEYLIGRKLYPNEVVHHINGIRTDNSIENLELMTRSEHARHHALENYSKRNRNKKGQLC